MVSKPAKCSGASSCPPSRILYVIDNARLMTQRPNRPRSGRPRLLSRSHVKNRQNLSRHSRSFPRLSPRLCGGETCWEPVGFRTHPTVPGREPASAAHRALLLRAVLRVVFLPETSGVVLPTQGNQPATLISSSFAPPKNARRSSSNSTQGTCRLASG